MRRLEDALHLCSINTATLAHRLPIEEAVEAVARAGYGGIAPWRRDVEGSDLGAVSRRIRDAGLTVSGLCRSTYIPAASRAGFEAALADNRAAIAAAETLGAACFVMVVGGLPGGSRNLPDARAQLLDGLGSLLDHARSTGVRLALEPLHPMYAADRSCLNTIAQALEICDTLEPAPGASPTLGLALDAYHVWWDPALAAGTSLAGRAGRIFAFHVCDWLRETRHLLTDRGMMGDGVIDLKSIRYGVEAAGYSGPVEVEIFSALDWWRRPVPQVLDVCAARLRSLC